MSNKKRKLGVTIGVIFGFFAAAIMPKFIDSIQHITPKFVISPENNPVAGFIVLPLMFGVYGAISTSVPEEKSS